MKRGTALVYVSLLANVVIFFHKPLFSLQYSFPWDFRTVQLPLMSFLADTRRREAMRAARTGEPMKNCP